MPITRDLLKSQIPSWILEEYPNFYEFLAAYYEWMAQDGNAYKQLKEHNDYFTFEKTLDSYQEFMFKEYLTDIPESALHDKEQFIRWSRKFNLSRGSHESIKFLFKVLFNEQTTEVYVPKDNILKLSDGVWISGQSKIQITYNVSNSENFQFQRVYQERPVYKDIVERASAVVQSVKTKYVGRYVITELTVSDVEGEFKAGFPVQTTLGASEWLIPTVEAVEVSTGGSNYQKGQRVTIDNLSDFEVERVATESGEFDSRVTSSFTEADISVFVNDVEVFDTSFDGRIVYSPSIAVDDDVKVVFPAYQGYLVVDEVTDTGEILSIEILELTVGDVDGSTTTVQDSDGTGYAGTTTSGFVKPVKGYYEGSRGQLSADMYLQDSFYYQNFSYVIKTQQDFSAYADIVKKVLHPAGFALFGEVNVVYFIELLLKYVESSLTIIPVGADFAVMSKYPTGANFSIINKIRDRVSSELYNADFLASLDTDFVDGEVGYNLEAFSLSRHPDYEYSPLKGFMDKSKYADMDLYIPQDYVEDLNGVDRYFEDGYVE